MRPLEALLKAVDGRGLVLRLDEDGQPRVSGPRDQLTPALLAALKAFRREIIERLGGKPAPAPAPPPPREWLWKGGCRYTEQPDDAGYSQPAWHPVGAWWWRRRGESAWQLVPGREEFAKGHEPPEA